MLTNMRLSYIYETSYTSTDENGITSHVKHIDVFTKFIRGTRKDYTLYNFDVENFLKYLATNETITEKLHFQLINLATSFTLKGAKKVAMLQGNSRDIMQECDLIEARNNAYASILLAIKEGQFVKLAEDYTSALNDENLQECETIFNATKKALASLCYKMVNAYTYQLKRDSRHLSVDAMMTDSDGDEVPIIETIAHEHIDTVHEKKRIQDLLDAMSNKQLKAMTEALNEKQLTRYTKVLDAMLQAKPLTSSDTRFYQRSNNAIQEIYKTL